ncbi:unnamed protein product [Paramecium octaurelia]|uniref:Uncharacterized protein n=1 Tax=Paramecium octaurelia TaxID=43137 RepID=A0A8S1Y938_PAROT|nr:unnamed protein product [Paramecium octaurelia]
MLLNYLKIIHFKLNLKDINLKNISELPAGVEPKSQQNKIEAAGPFENRLKPILNDISSKNKPAQKVRILGDTNDYNPLANDLIIKFKMVLQLLNLQFARISKCLFCKSLYQSILQNKVLSQFYYGCGFKATINHFYSEQPQQVSTEQSDLPQQPEPKFHVEVPQQQQD